MKDLLHYCYYRQDLSFQEKPFNEIDAILFSMLSYIVWDGIETKTENHVRELCTKCSLDKNREEYILLPQLANLVEVVATSDRYKDVIVKQIEERNDPINLIQFSACTFELQKEFTYVSFRGTDTSIHGWKEDLTMLYQEDLEIYNIARNYVEKILSFEKKRVFGKKKFYIGGHSKGGNQAVGAYLKAPHLQQRITRVYNFDGPGFHQSFLQQHDAMNHTHKINTYLPEFSIIGRLFHQAGEVTIVKGYGHGLIQHDATNWVCGFHAFETTPVFCSESDDCYKELQTLIMEKDVETKKEYVQAVFSFLDALEVTYINDFTEVDVKQALGALKEMTTYTNNQRKFLIQSILFLFKQGNASMLTKK